MSLKSLAFPPVLETSTSDILQQLVVPALLESVRFDRGVGYFTSQWLSLAATGLAAVAARGGRGRLIVSPKLAPDDWAGLAEGSQALHDPALLEALKRSIDELSVDLLSEPVRALAWMIADGLLDIRLAIPANALDGDFHDKFGLFVDFEGNRVAFHGSMNDSAQAFRNYESLDVFTSWGGEGDASRVTAHEQRFERLWTNADLNVRVYDLPEAIRRNLVEFTSHSDRPYSAPGPSPSDTATLWRHQDDAIAAFLTARAGILEMATGSGKTRTAIRIINELHSRRQIDFVIVCAGGPDLLDQWRNQLATSTSMPLYCTYGGSHDEMAFLSQTRDAVWIASREALSGLLARMPMSRRARTLLICDEVHGMGAPSVVVALKDIVRTFGFRLGLSATPEREYDADGNAFIDAEIGPVIYRFGLAEAIKRGILCEFDYVALPYVFSDEDKRKVRDTVAAYHAGLKSGRPMTLEWLWLTLSGIAKEAHNKIPAFASYLSDHPSLLRRTLIFVQTMAFGELVQPLILAQTRDFHTYYGSDDQRHLKRFARGELKVLITAHRISEGIDIQSVDTIVLFSAARARLETIQRLGRCLRTDPNNSSKRALVVDFVRADLEPHDDPDHEHADHERARWLAELAATRHSFATGE